MKRTFYLLYLENLYDTLLALMTRQNKSYPFDSVKRREVDFLHAINAVAAFANHISISGAVLVIDDEDSVRDAIREILGSAGIPVITAVNGSSGVQIYQNQQQEIGLVLLDLSMPGLSGSETFAQLRRINPDVPVVLTSGYSESEALGHFNNHGSLRGFIQKPFRMETLIRTISTHLPNGVDNT